jgi:uncharacterized membrane-anchored protein YhcB (DUF1043 family)
MDLAPLIPIIVLGLIVFYLVVRLINKMTIKKKVESDWEKRRRKMQERVRQRRNRSGSGTKFKKSLVNNPNERKWQKLKARAKLER